MELSSIHILTILSSPSLVICPPRWSLYWPLALLQYLINRETGYYSNVLLHPRPTVWSERIHSSNWLDSRRQKLNWNVRSTKATICQLKLLDESIRYQTFENQKCFWHNYTHSNWSSWSCSSGSNLYCQYYWQDCLRPFFFRYTYMYINWKQYHQTNLSFIKLSKEKYNRSKVKVKKKKCSCQPMYENLLLE